MSRRFVLFLACAIYLVFGIFLASICPVLGELSRRTGASLAAIGGVLTFLFLESLIAQVSTGPLNDRYGQKIILPVSLFLISLSIIGFTTTQSLSWMLVSFLFVGLGQGGIDMGSNLMVADTFPRRITSYLNLLHFFFGVGAFTGPILVGLAIASTGSGVVIQQIAAGFFQLIAFASLFLLKNKPHIDLTSPHSLYQMIC